LENLLPLVVHTAQSTADATSKQYKQDLLNITSFQKKEVIISSTNFVESELTKSENINTNSKSNFHQQTIHQGNQLLLLIVSLVVYATCRSSYPSQAPLLVAKQYLCHGYYEI